MRISLLLGAGASHDAGLPLTNALARDLVTKLNDEQPSSTSTQLLNSIYAAMVNFSAARGGNPLAAVNVETMFSAIRLLRDRKDHEAAPFVLNWVRLADGHGDGAPYGGDFLRARQLARGVAEAFGDSAGAGDNLLDAVREVVRSEIGGSVPREAFEELERSLLRALVDLLAHPADLSYLNPLLDLAEAQAGGLDVVTLNYDLTVETAAAQRGVEVTRGVEVRQPGADFDFSPRDRMIRLVKLHGSLDFYLETVEVPGGLPQKITKINQDPTDLMRDPALVIGQREKLETEGPTLALMRAFEDVMRRTDRLVIVGYSGGDAHVNAVIRDWINADTHRTIVVLDPYWPTLGFFEKRGFPYELNSYLGVQQDDETPRRLVVIRAAASVGLKEALTAEVELDPQPWFDVDATISGTTVTITVTNRGRSLGPTQFYAQPPVWNHPAVPYPREVRVLHPEASNDDQVYGAVNIPRMAAGETVSVEITYDAAEACPRWVLRITGAREIDRVTEIFDANGKFNER